MTIDLFETGSGKHTILRHHLGCYGIYGILLMVPLQAPQWPSRIVAVCASLHFHLDQVQSTACCLSLALLFVRTKVCFRRSGRLVLPI